MLFQRLILVQAGNKGIFQDVTNIKSYLSKWNRKFIAIEKKNIDIKE